jgi:hypothetical protein
VQGRQDREDACGAVALQGPDVLELAHVNLLCLGGVARLTAYSVSISYFRGF